jgi:hypothetical protein
MDPTKPLYDKYWMPGGWVRKAEEPQLSCPCAGTGWLGREWLYKRAPQCSCESQTDNFDTVLHALWCDSVPCPFCPMEDTNDVPGRSHA